MSADKTLSTQKSLKHQQPVNVYTGYTQKINNHFVDKDATAFMNEACVFL